MFDWLQILNQNRVRGIQYYLRQYRLGYQYPGVPPYYANPDLRLRILAQAVRRRPQLLEGDCALRIDVSRVGVSVPQQAAEEMMAIAWSYGACRHLGLDPTVIFHAGGYWGGSDNILSSFSSPSPIGVPMLQYVGLTYYGDRAAERGVPPFPAMQQWTLP